MYLYLLIKKKKTNHGVPKSWTPLSNWTEFKNEMLVNNKNKGRVNDPADLQSLSQGHQRIHDFKTI